MKSRWNILFKKLLMSSVVGLLASTSIYAAERGLGNKRDVCPDDMKPGPFAFTYAKDIGLACPSDFYAFGEYLLISSYVPACGRHRICQRVRRVAQIQKKIQCTAGKSSFNSPCT